MSVVTGGPSAANIVTRVTNILLKPAAEWDVIAGETATPQSLFLGYACILAAIPAVAQIIVGLFPICVLGICVHSNPIFAVLGGILSYVLSLVGVYLIGLIIDALAPSFGGEKNQIQALKVAVYSFTAAWVAGVFSLLAIVNPFLAFIGIVGLYSFYLLYVGLPKLMKSPPDKALGYTAVSIVLGIIVFIITAVIGGQVQKMGSGALGAGNVTIGANTLTPNGRVTVNGTTIDLGRLQAAANQAAAAAQSAENGKAAPAIDPDKLKALLPDSVAGLPRTEVSANSVGAMGGASNVEAVYSSASGDQRITLSVTDLAAAQGLAAMAGAMNVNESRETATGYEKTSSINGRMTTEEWDNQSHSGKFSVLVASRFVVEANGTAPNIDVLKAAVAAVGPDRLQAMKG